MQIRKKLHSPVPQLDLKFIAKFTFYMNVKGGRYGGASWPTR